MAGDALLPSPLGRDRTFPDLLELFAAVMLGQLTPDDATSRMAADARRSAREAITSNRAPVGSQEILALRSIYDQVRALGPVTAPEATQKNAVLGRTRAARVMDATLRLRHRQRAALALHDLGSIAPNDVASVLGVTTTRAHEVVEAARAALLKRLPRPMNIRHVLRDASTRLISPEIEAPHIEATHIEAPRTRGVVETLIAPTPSIPPRRAVAPAASGLLTVDLLQALEEAPADMRIEPRQQRPAEMLSTEVSQRRRTPSHTRVWLAAACALLAVALVLPAAARAPQYRATPPTQHVVTPGSSSGVETTTRVAAVAITVRQAVVARGDSLWAIAGRSTGDPNRWREIWRLNANRLMPDGSRFADPNLILPGWRLRLPSPRS